MEKDPNLLPDFNIFPRLTTAARFISRILTPNPRSAPDFMSNHYRPSKQVDVGKSEAKAREVQLVIEGLQDYGRDE